MTGRTLLVVSTRKDTREARAAAPMRDYEAMRAATGADIIDSPHVVGGRSMLAASLVLAARAAALAGRYDYIYADGEHTAFPLAAMLKPRASRPRLTCIGHYLTPSKKKRFVRALRLRSAVDGIAIHSAAQLEHAREMGFEERQIRLIPYQVDTDFWQPQERAPARMIASAGLECRDYATLLRAASGVSADFEVAAASPWSKRRPNTDGIVPPNIRLVRHGYVALRDMYARARFVVVPLQDVDFQAGIITILEAMAMGKAVIVSRTRGQVGVVSGPLIDARQSSIEIVANERYHPNGVYVPPADPAALRAAIEHLLTHPAEAAMMGANGRRMVTEAMSLELFTSRMASFIKGGG